MWRGHRFGEMDTDHLGADRAAKAWGGDEGSTTPAADDGGKDVMALIQPAQPEAREPEGRRGRKAVRYAVPVAVVGVAAATIGLVPALADSGDPSLPSLTAEQIITKIAASDTQT